jgi:hypothetical protein
MVLGVEPKIIDFGLELTPEVQAALPQFVRLSKQIPAQWGLVPPAQEKQQDLSLVNAPEKPGLLFEGKTGKLFKYPINLC